jgi:hypothetical protein
MGEAKARRRFAEIHGDSSARIRALPPEEIDLLHAMTLDAAQGIAANMALAAAAAQADHPDGPNAVISGAVAGLAHMAWKMKGAGLSRQQVEDLLIKGLRHALAEAERGEMMGRPVQGHG